MNRLDGFLAFISLLAVLGVVNQQLFFLIMAFSILNVLAIVHFIICLANCRLQLWNFKRQIHWISGNPDTR
ncbi:hypothetical protein [Paenibacillus radicis (ex Xue et al. 2023)]|uniref:DUF4395 domain-containing protein n=1 Tax=Paenibacillus radicis (ex Xue et al. 2023) TaxID=2972489 RepID=A0ABT1YV32_9BACL|nr:hypothetical protein [Paenibacillus radicis (ex Xue et al. 2023)]MCR8636788.1 hypothetical protein [Paenibacillus radicis (ex Xue et al. 2023)]